MSVNDLVKKRYLESDYAQENPQWDIEDSPWKAQRVAEVLSCLDQPPNSICEVGCGAGGVLAGLRRFYPQAALHGFDIAPGAARFWDQHSAAGIHFQLGDFFVVNKTRYDVVLLLDVLEHLSDPFNFLARLRSSASMFVIHFPLDLSAVNLVREQPLLHVRKKVGHIHYFTKGLALALLDECGYEVIEWRYTNAAFGAPKRTWKSRLAGVPRGAIYALNKDLGVRLLGGETLMVLSQPR